MALAKRCDRCGRFHEHYKGEALGCNTNAISLMNINHLNNYVEDSKLFNLCPQCLEELVIFITSNKENNNAKD